MLNISVGNDFFVDSNNKLYSSDSFSATKSTKGRFNFLVSTTVFSEMPTSSLANYIGIKNGVHLHKSTKTTRNIKVLEHSSYKRAQRGKKVGENA